jgi:hypothetical protein
MKAMILADCYNEATQRDARVRVRKLALQAFKGEVNPGMRGMPDDKAFEKPAVPPLRCRSD